MDRSQPIKAAVAHRRLRRHAIQRLSDTPYERRALTPILSQILRACATSADPERALLGIERLASALPNRSMFYHYLENAPDRIKLLVRIFAHSQALADTLARNAKNLHLLIAPQALERPREKTSLTAELSRILAGLRTTSLRYDAIRQFRRRETLRIGARDLTGRATVEETTLELSNLADVCLQAVVEIALEKLSQKFQIPAANFVVIGMGKLGGQELNYSSDVDVMFVYDEDRPLNAGVNAHEFFTKVAGEIVQVVGAPGPEGSIFRMDLRLRPEGATGPLVRSLDSYENYYAQYGETWERMALIKARPVAGDKALGREFVEMVQPFVYPRHAGEYVLRQMAAIKRRIESEIVGADALTRHVKLGIGGIREIEFIVQSFQVLRGARLPQLRHRSTLPSLERFVKTKTLTGPEATALANAYRFLRNVEHRLQMEMDLQTHTIPDEQRALERLSRSLGFETVEKFFRAQRAHTHAVRGIYEAVLAESATRAAESGENLLTKDQLPAMLQEAGCADVASAVNVVESLWTGPGYAHVSARTQELFAHLLPSLLEVARRLPDPDSALARFEKFVSAYGSRGLLYETFSRHPRLAEMLLRLGDASRFLSDLFAQQPELFDEFTQSDALSETKDPDRQRRELAEFCRSRAEDVPLREAVRLWKGAEMLRMGVEDVMGWVDLERLHQQMTWLAETCLDVAVRESNPSHRPFAVIGMGKFGGQELVYGADLDVLFVGNEPSVAAKIIEFMVKPTRAGILFKVDPRLRPDGEKGPLAVPLDAYREYYRHRAQFWEWQALVKARTVAGDPELGQRFLCMAHEIIYGGPLTADQIRHIQHMRHRIETERGDPKHPEREFKTGPGGLVDVEFLVQALQLRHGHAHPPVRVAHTLAALNRLTALGVVEDGQSHHLRQGYLFFRRIESVLRRMDNTSVSQLPSHERELTCLAKRLGFATAAAFLEDYRGITRRIRSLYDQWMSSIAV